MLETVGVNVTADQRYYAYGKQRDAGPVVTDHRFTGQKSRLGFKPRLTAKVGSSRLLFRIRQSTSVDFGFQPEL